MNAEIVFAGDQFPIEAIHAAFHRGRPLLVTQLLAIAAVSWDGIDRRSGLEGEHSDSLTERGGQEQRNPLFLSTFFCQLSFHQKG